MTFPTGRRSFKALSTLHSFVLRLAIPARMCRQAQAQPASKGGRRAAHLHLMHSYKIQIPFFIPPSFFERPVPLIQHLPCQNKADCEGPHIFKRRLLGPAQSKRRLQGPAQSKRWIRVPNHFVLALLKRCKARKGPKRKNATSQPDLRPKVVIGLIRPKSRKIKENSCFVPRPTPKRVKP